jgi:hypothetical protein
MKLRVNQIDAPANPGLVRLIEGVYFVLYQGESHYIVAECDIQVDQGKIDYVHIDGVYIFIDTNGLIENSEDEMQYAIVDRLDWPDMTMAETVGVHFREHARDLILDKFDYSKIL